VCSSDLRCDGPGGWPQRLGPHSWWIAGAEGDSTPDNRGATSNLLAVRDGRRLWLVGSGGTPRQGQRVACALRAVGAGTVTDLVLPWPHAELTLGASAFAGARRWAHADVAALMRERCPRCAERMAARLGEAAADLGQDPIRLPTATVSGAQGRLGPFEWWRLQRGEDTAVMVLSWGRRQWWSAHGLAWGEGPPDLRDGDALRVADALGTLLGQMPPGARIVPEQGPLLRREDLEAQRAGLRALVDAVDAALRRGALVTDEPPPAQRDPHPRQGLNWQRTWAQREGVVF
jgi:hypothetical protein